MKTYDDNDNYQMIINNLKIGDIVSFRLKNFDFTNIKGEVRDFYLKKNRFYIKIYSFFKRKEFKFILIEDLKLVKPKKDKQKSKNHYDNYMFNYNKYEEKNKQVFNNNFLSIFIKIFTVLTVFIFLITTVPDLKIYFFPLPYSYEKFLSKKFSINKLYSIVVNRIIYIPDIKDEWMTPQYAWINRYGDCEEYANIISDYLNHYNIENYVAGLNTKVLLTGHAVVFLKKNNNFYILDPTRAIEKRGIKKLNNIACLRDAIIMYSGLPVCIYKVPSFNHEKKVIEVIY